MLLLNHSGAGLAAAKLRTTRRDQTPTARSQFLYSGRVHWIRRETAVPPGSAQNAGTSFRLMDFDEEISRCELLY
jgi:hypothetical protein